jgi:exosortase
MPADAFDSAAAGSPAGLRAAATPARAVPAALPLTVFLAAVAAIYAPSVADAAHVWLTDDNCAHGIFILPASALLVWLSRPDLIRAEKKPDARGLWLLGFGLLTQMIGYLLQLPFIGMWSLVPTLAGGVLALYGPAVWRIVQFPAWFLLLAAPLPNVLIGWLTHGTQRISTDGASDLMTLVGFTLVQHGNIIGVPGAQLEVADACSGTHKLMSLIAFSLLYGHVYAVGPLKRLALLVAAVPIALVANVLRISSLIVAGTYYGSAGVHAAHDPSEYAAIVVAFLLFVFAGKLIGCKTLRFSL